MILKASMHFSHASLNAGDHTLAEPVLVDYSNTNTNLLARALGKVKCESD
jgi:hypothetical protein